MENTCKVCGRNHINGLCTETAGCLEDLHDQLVEDNFTGGDQRNMNSNDYDMFVYGHSDSSGEPDRVDEMFKKIKGVDEQTFIKSAKKIGWFFNAENNDVLDTLKNKGIIKMN